MQMPIAIGRSSGKRSMGSARASVKLQHSFRNPQHAAYLLLSQPASGFTGHGLRGQMGCPDLNPVDDRLQLLEGGRLNQVTFHNTILSSLEPRFPEPARKIGRNSGKDAECPLQTSYVRHIHYNAMFLATTCISRMIDVSRTFA